MTMADLEKMMGEAVTSPEEAAQVASLEQAEYTIQPTGFQLNAESQPVTIYHALTGEPRTMPRVYARTALLKRFRVKDGAALAGKFVFKANKADVPEYVLGSVKCFLHPDRPDRALYTSWGLPVCSSEHFPSDFEAERHIETDHSNAWSRIKDMRARAREDEDRQLQRDLLKGLAQAAMPNQPVVAATTAAATTVEFDNPVSKHIHQYPKAMGAKCKVEGCGAVRTAEFRKRNGKT